MTAMANTASIDRTILETLGRSLRQDVTQAIAALSENMDSDTALRRTAALLLAEAARTLSAAADNGREIDSRTFEAMFDVNAAANHFHAAMIQGIRHAADGIRKDGYSPSCALVLSASRAVDAVADILEAG